LPRERLLAAAAGDLRGPLAQFSDELLHPHAPLVELLGRVGLGAENGHVEQL
jgi:hypothetical protein